VFAEKLNRCRSRSRRIPASIAVVTLGALLGAPISTATMTVQPDGKIVLAGTGQRELRGFGALVRYLPQGELDPTFADDGILLDRRFNPFSALAVQRDGRILVAAHRSSLPLDAKRFTFARYLASGRPDLAFGKGGAVKEEIGFAPAAILPRDDGRFTVGANGPYEPVAPAQNSVGFARTYAADGSSFRNAGNVYAEAPGGGSRSNGLADLLARPDGSLIAAGAFSPPNAAFLARFTPDAINFYDQSFGGGAGIVDIAPPPLPGSRATALAAAGNDLVVVGAVGDEMLVARFDGDGRFDTSFGNDGLVTLAMAESFATEANAAVVQPDGKIVVVGTTRRRGSDAGGDECDFCAEAVVIRFTADGALDPAFGSGGTARVFAAGRGSPQTIGDDVSLLPGGKILVAARPLAAGDATFALARFDPDGKLDPSFGSGGLVTTETCPGSEAQKRRARCLPSARVGLRVARFADGSLRLRAVVGSNIARARVREAKLLLPGALRFRPAFVNATNECRRLCGYGGGSNSHAVVKAFPGGIVFSHASMPRLSFVLAGYAFERSRALRTDRKFKFRVMVRFGPGEAWQTVALKRSVS
jgi:uncharacterized delta-60 repeat protein